jgi:type I restriction enzyme, S subunit
MNAELLLAHFNRISDAPNVVVRMRRFILDLAVRGKLIEQDSRDEPGNLLVGRLPQERLQRNDSKDTHRPVAQSPSREESLPFSIPHSWEWSLLGTLVEKLTDGEHLSPIKTTSGMPLLTATHVTARGLTLENPQFVSKEDGFRSRKRCDPVRGDILICSRGTIGRCAVVDTDEIFCLMGSVILLRFPKEFSAKYFNYYLSTSLAQMQMRGMSGSTAVSALYLKDIRRCAVPVPR